ARRSRHGLAGSPLPVSFGSASPRLGEAKTWHRRQPSRMILTGNRSKPPFATVSATCKSCRRTVWWENNHAVLRPRKLPTALWLLQGYSIDGIAANAGSKNFWSDSISLLLLVIVNWRKFYSPDITIR